MSFPLSTGIILREGYPTNGEKIPGLSVSFDNKPFIPYSMHTTSDSFFLAYDEINQILFAYLGDSHKLFSFQVE
jgi:hypothetical protein